MSFYDSDQAAEMAEEYKKQARESLLKVEELLKDAETTERQIDTTHRILFRRRRVRLEIKLQRILLAILMALTPEEQDLGRQIYDRLVSCVDRLEKLC